jgi:polyisoprenoid-binding protein YceI
METTERTKIKWAIDSSHSKIGFKVKHLMITNVRGFFTEFDASIYTTSDNFVTATINCQINPASIHTGDENRDKHLKSADFFDVDTFKEINFIANSFEKQDNDGSFILYGNLTIKGVTKQLKLDVRFNGVAKDSSGNTRAAFSITGKMNRLDWGLNWNSVLETGGVLVSEDVYISCEVQLLKQT